MVGGCIIIDICMVCYCVHCVCLCLVYFIDYLISILDVLCEFEIVQYIPVIVVCWGLQRMMFGSVRFAG